MTNDTIEHPKFSDITDLINNLPDYPEYQALENNDDVMANLSHWLIHHSRILDTSKGFDVNRCAMYWAGYEVVDGFDGKAFVDACQDSRGSLNRLAQMLDTDLQIFELDPSNYNAKTPDEIAMATSYGMMAVEESTQLFCATSFGQGVEATAQKALNVINGFDDLEKFMTKHCGLNHAAMLGGAIASVMKGIPMIMEGTSGKFTKMLLERASGKIFPNLILTSDLNMSVVQSLPGHRMISTAIMLKTLWSGSEKTDCGKVKEAA